MTSRVAICALLGLSVALAGPFVGAVNLPEYVNRFANTRDAIDGDTLNVAEGFAAKVGEQHYYRFKMNTISMVSSSFDAANFNGLLDFQDSAQDLRLVRDADATIEFLTASGGKQLDELADKAGAAQSVEGLIVPSCRRYVDSLKSVFETDELLAEAHRDGQLATDFRTAGGSREAKEFLMGWAHYHVCKVLVQADRAALVDKVAKRAQDKRRIAMRTAELIAKRRAAGQS